MNFNYFSRETKANALMTFRNFLIRDHGFTAEEANMEVSEFIQQNGKIVVKPFYMTVRRTGATKTLDRAQRLSVYASLENAFRHNLT
jgi:hypothetical protein